MIELVQAFIEWRSAPQDVLMSLGPLAIAAITAGGSALLNSILNKPSGAEESLLRRGNEAAAAQAEQLRQQTAQREFLFDLLRGQIEGELNIDPSILFQFPEEAGGPALDVDTLLAQVEAANRGAMLDRLLGLTGAPVGQGLAAQGLQAGLGAAERERSGMSNTLQNLALILAQGGFGGGSQQQQSPLPHLTGPFPGT